MNKIEFFNNVMKLHDEENNVYNENVADIILSNDNSNFNIYYEIFERINESYKISPYIFDLFYEDDASKASSILKFTIKVEDDNLNEIYKLLKENAKEISNHYCMAKCSFKKSSKKNILYIYVDKINNFYNTRLH